MSCMTCDECVVFKCLALPQCPDEGVDYTLELGEVPYPSQDFNVYFSNTSNGVVQVLTGQTNEDGKLSMSLLPIIPYLTDRAVYDVWVTDPLGQLHEHVPFTYAEDEQAECAKVRFERVYRAGDGFPYNIQDQKLTI